MSDSLVCLTCGWMRATAERTRFHIGSRIPPKRQRNHDIGATTLGVTFERDAEALGTYGARLQYWQERRSGRPLLAPPWSISCWERHEPKLVSPSRQRRPWDKEPYVTDRLKILVNGMVAGVPRQGGATWAVLQYLLGFRRLGHDVYFVEPVQEASLLPSGASLLRSENATYFNQVMSEFGFEQNAALLQAGTRHTVGMSYDPLRRVASSADALINVSGILTDEALVEKNYRGGCTWISIRHLHSSGMPCRASTWDSLDTIAS